MLPIYRIINNEFIYLPHINCAGDPTFVNPSLLMALAHLQMALTP